MSLVCGNGERCRKMFRRLARKTAEALMPPLASRSRRNPPYGTTFDQNGPSARCAGRGFPWRSRDKYAVIVSHFEPTKRWEEAALVFSFHSGQAVEKPVVQLQLVGAGASRRGVAARWRSRTFFWTPQRAGLLLRSPSAKPRLSSSARTTVQRRMSPKSPAEKAEAAGKPFFPARFTLTIPLNLCRLQAGSSWTVAGFPAILTDRKREAQ